MPDPKTSADLRGLDIHTLPARPGSLSETYLYTQIFIFQEKNNAGNKNSKLFGIKTKAKEKMARPAGFELTTF